MRWQIKALGQRILSNTPGGKKLYYILQRIFFGFRSFSALSKVSQGLGLLSGLSAVGYTVDEKRTLEIGTGWTPVIPILFYVFGQRSCDSFDLERLLKANLALRAARQIAGLGEHLAKHAQFAWNPICSVGLSALQDVNTLSQLLATINMRYHAPVDARFTCLPAGSVDIVFSNTTLEHIPSPWLVELFREAYRVLVPEGGVMVHLIDCSDHFSHGDRTISTINFLRFPHDRFQRYSSKFLYQNRLRAGSYRRLANEAGFDVIFWDARVDQKAVASLDTFPLDKEFARLSPEEICTTSVTMVARKRK